MSITASHRNKMKTALHLVFLMIGCAMSSCGAPYAAADEPKHQQNENKPAQRTGHDRAANKNHARGLASTPKANHPQQSATNRTHAVTGSTTGSRQSPANGSLNGLPGKNGSANRARAAQPAHVSRSPASVNALHHSPNPARVGGPAIPNAKNSASINGASVKRKP